MSSEWLRRFGLLCPSPLTIHTRYGERRVVRCRYPICSPCQRYRAWEVAGGLCRRLDEFLADGEVSIVSVLLNHNANVEFVGSGLREHGVRVGQFVNRLRYKPLTRTFHVRTFDKSFAGRSSAGREWSYTRHYLQRLQAQLKAPVTDRIVPGVPRPVHYFGRDELGEKRGGAHTHLTAVSPVVSGIPSWAWHLWPAGAVVQVIDSRESLFELMSYVADLTGYLFRRKDACAAAVEAAQTHCAHSVWLADEILRDRLAADVSLNAPGWVRHGLENRYVDVPVRSLASVERAWFSSWETRPAPEAVAPHVFMQAARFSEAFARYGVECFLLPHPVTVTVGDRSFRLSRLFVHVDDGVPTVGQLPADLRAAFPWRMDDPLRPAGDVSEETLRRDAVKQVAYLSGGVVHPDYSLRGSRLRTSHGLMARPDCADEESAHDDVESIGPAGREIGRRAEARLRLDEPGALGPQPELGDEPCR